LRPSSGCDKFFFIDNTTKGRTMFDFFTAVHESLVNAFYEHQPAAWAILAGVTAGSIALGFILRTFDEKASH
jgi:hypothetical protein